MGGACGEVGVWERGGGGWGNEGGDGKREGAGGRRGRGEGGREVTPGVLGQVWSRPLDRAAASRKKSPWKFLPSNFPSTFPTVNPRKNRIKIAFISSEREKRSERTARDSHLAGHRQWRRGESTRRREKAKVVPVRAKELQLTVDQWKGRTYTLPRIQDDAATER